MKSFPFYRPGFLTGFRLYLYKCVVSILGPYGKGVQTMVLKKSGNAITVVACFLSAALFSWVSHGAEPPRLDVNDVTFLWPAPTSKSDADKLISAAEKPDDGEDTIWPTAAFERVIATAQTVSLKVSPADEVRQISFSESKDAFERMATWKIAAFRVDASAPGSHSKIIGLFGSKPQIRLIVQPVTVREDVAIVHDVAAHLVFDFASSGTDSPAVEGFPARSIPDRERFQDIIDDLVQLKEKAKAANIDTDGPLGIHPGLREDNPEFRNAVGAFLKKHLSAARMNAVAFMGIQRPEPWIFFAMIKRDNEWQRTGHPAVPGELAQMFSRRDSLAVFPMPRTNTFTRTEGVSTAQLFMPGAAQRLDAPALPESEDAVAKTAKLGHIPDIIANPHVSHFFNTDCVSCHTESVLRRTLSINLIQALGGVFYLKLVSDDSERRVFSVAVSGVPSPDIQSTFELVVRYGYFHRSSIGNKDGTGRTRLYVLTRRLAPYFKLDPSSFAGYLWVTNDFLQEAMTNPESLLRRLKKGNIDTELQTSQLTLFE